MNSFTLYTVAAFAEILGCFTFWAWLRLEKSFYWVFLGTIALVIFAVLLSHDQESAQKNGLSVG